MGNAVFFKEVSLLVTHYNRSKSLERLLMAFRSLHISFEEIVVSDDGSKPEHLEVLQSYVTKYGIRLVTTPTNKGLGNNLNKGQDAIKTPYTLYVQEDFDPYPLFAEKMELALKLLKKEDTLDMIRFYAYFKYPYLKPVEGGFSEMKFSILYPGYKKFYQYSDHPHLRRTSFFEKFGRYTEGTKGDVTEFNMMMSFLRHRGKGLFYEDFKGLFNQLNTSDEPSTMKRDYWRESRNPLVSIARLGYRHFKLNREYLFGKF
ncbi:MAG TPA: glycosyltransferase [Flavipsychrobacter sp.]|nr:glycosyltransferase [Flavipsychrobacter sp.]